MLFTIYKATNLVNGKSYVGFATNWPARKNSHIHDAFVKHTDDHCRHFHRALRKYGKDNFSWEVLYQSSDHHYTLNTMEEHYIRQYKSHSSEHGYNLTYGGEGSKGWIPSQETRQRISDANKGRIFSDETRALWSKQRTGRKLSPEHIAAVVAGNQRTWNVLKNGVPLTILNMSKYCRERGLSQGNMSYLVHGKLKRYKEYTAVQI